MSGSFVAGFLAMVAGMIVYAFAYLKYREQDVAILRGFAVAAIVFVLIKVSFTAWLWNEERIAGKRRQEIERLVQTDPPFAALKQYLPEIYKNALHAIDVEVKTLPADKTVFIHEARGRAPFLLAFDDRLKIASDEAVAAYAAALAGAADELGKRDPKLCAVYLYRGLEGRQNFATLLSAPTQKAEAAAMAEIFKSSVAAPQPRAGSAQDGEIYRILQPVIADLLKEFGNDWQIINSPFAKGVDNAKLCSFTAAYYREILDLPAADAGLVLRRQLRTHS